METWSKWQFLSPFFSRHGLQLYEYFPRTDRGARPPVAPKSVHTSEMPWPWARKAYEQEEDIEFDFLTTTRVWPARDAGGHEVIIRLASSGPVPSEELKVFWRLNTVEARSDSRNYTLPVLKYLTFNDLVFVVMPRWDTMAYNPWAPASTVLELIQLTETFYEGLQFLHEQRIAHRDIHPSNTVMNALITRGEDVFDLRSADSVRYAYIDYDASVAFPEDSDIETLRTDRLMRNPIRYMGYPPGICNPFKDDILCMTSMTQTMVRVVENVVPEIGDFFDSILRCEYEDVPSASQALKSFRELRSRMTDDQLRHPPGGSFWKNGRIRK
ncbi:hypothetical protein FA13DRAFT_1731624 [Coprinellus micaceus]|uniref:Protein kinase domain-containing protein n=1 Tax=Coprinellus micaceus TaxID=71717 RepID=A0A4Y7TE20_COPMI|nr:hypothetical protein FA13DRAFT_1731624 [Coprinellus micaceus]